MESDWDLGSRIPTGTGFADTTVNAKRTDRFSRSRQMVSLLRQEFIYSEKKSRNILFQEIQEILSNASTRPIVARLTREAALRGRRRAEQVAYEVSNWDTAAKATVNAMIRAGAFLSDDGRPIRLSITALAAPVFALREGYADLTEAH